MTLASGFDVGNMFLSRPTETTILPTDWLLFGGMLPGAVLAADPFWKTSNACSLNLSMIGVDQPSGRSNGAKRIHTTQAASTFGIGGLGGGGGGEVWVRPFSLLFRHCCR